MDDIMSNFRNLGFAVVNKAIQDYIDGCKYSKTVSADSKRYQTLLNNYLSAVDFFLSDNFNMYCDFNGDEILSFLEDTYGFFTEANGEVK